MNTTVAGYRGNISRSNNNDLLNNQGLLGKVLTEANKIVWPFISNQTTKPRCVTINIGMDPDTFTDDIIVKAYIVTPPKDFILNSIPLGQSLSLVSAIDFYDVYTLKKLSPIAIRSPVIISPGEYMGFFSLKSGVAIRIEGYANGSL